MKHYDSSILYLSLVNNYKESPQKLVFYFLVEGYGVYCHFQQYFSYIVAVSFIGGGNQSSWRKQPSCSKSLTNYISDNVVSSTPHHERDSNSQL